MSRTANLRSILETINASGNVGVLTRDIQVALGLKQASCGVRRLALLGAIGYVTEARTLGRGRATARRYYGRAHCPPGAVLLDEVAAPNITGPKPLTVKEQRAALVPTGPAITPKGVKVTICPSSRDTRYTVHEVAEPLFSTLGIGRYLKRDTAVQRALSGS